MKYNIGDSVLAYLDHAECDEFIGTVTAITGENTYLVEDQDGDVWDCDENELVSNY
jgi:hypothetical protein